MPNIIKVGGGGINKSTTGTYLKGRNFVSCIPLVSASKAWYVNKKYLAWANSNGYYLYSSDDGATWTKCNVSGYSSSRIDAAFYVNGKYVVADLSRTDIYYSTDAVTWTLSYNHCNRSVVCVSGSIFFIDTSSSSKRSYVMKSTDGGVTWSTALASGTTYDFSALNVINNKIICAYQYSGGTNYISYDYGATFEVLSGLSVSEYVNGLYFGTKGNYLAYSSDGKTWTTTSVTGHSGSVIYFDGMYYVSTSSGLRTSGDLSDWYSLREDVSSSLTCLNGVLFHGDASSTDGRTWHSLSSYPSTSIQSNGTNFVGYSYSNGTYTYYYSTNNARSWTQFAAQTNEADLAVVNGWYYTSQRRSKDGINWEAISIIGNTVPSYVGDKYFKCGSFNYATSTYYDFLMYS